MTMTSLPRSGAISLMIHGGLLFLLLSASGFVPAPPLVPRVHFVTRLSAPAWRTAIRHEAGGSSAGQMPALLSAPPKRTRLTFITPVAEEPRLQLPMTMEAPEMPMPDRPGSFGDPVAGILAGTGIGADWRGFGNGRNGGAGDESGPGVQGDPAGTVYRVGNGITAPVVTHRVSPEFSEEARKAKYSGTVTLRIDVDPTGHARNIRVVRSAGMGLDEKAMEAVRQWLFRPGTKAGKPVTVSAQVDVSFHLL